MGKIIVIEGLDGSGKATQTKLLYEHLIKKGYNTRRLSFPDYNSPSSSLVKMYLNGEFGTAPDDVNGYAAAVFYAADRCASFMRDWREDYNKGVYILCDRYVSSNAVYQMTKVRKEEWEGYLAWLEQLEYERLGVPRPDIVIYLDVPTEISQRLISERYGGDDNKKDIHERNLSYLADCGRAAAYAAKKCGWHIISCVRDGRLRNIEDISAEIIKTLEKRLGI